MSGSSGPYSVGMLGPVRDRLHDIARRAAAAGRGHLVAAAFADIVARLRANPHEFGEPMYHLRAMRMGVRNAAIDPLYVEYGVHDSRPVVVIRVVRWLNDPLDA